MEIKQLKKDSDISLHEFIILIGEWRRYLLKKWIAILGGVLIGALGLAAYSIFSKPKYEATLTFVMEDSKSGGLLGAYSGVASQLGIDLSVGSSSMGIFADENNVMAFLKSRLMIEQALLSVVEVDGKLQTLADIYIDNYHLREKLDKKSQTKDLHFSPNQPRSTFSRLQDSVLNVLQKRVVKVNLDISKEDKKASFIGVTTTSYDEVFSKVFTERLVKSALDFYISTKTMRSRINVDKLQTSADSLEILLNSKTHAIATMQDLNVNPARKQASVNADIQSRDKMVLQTMYSEVVKNLELNKMSMAQETPIVQIVDTPILPLDKKKLGLMIGLIIGSILGGFIVTFYLIFRRLLKLEEERTN